MISKQSGTFWNVREIVSLFQQMGREIHTSQDTVKSIGGVCFYVRYLLNPANKAFVPLADLEDDQSISKWEAHVLERGGMRNTWLRGRENVHKRYLVHVESVG